MVSKNYKNVVVSSILKEDFDPQQFNQQIKAFEKTLDNMISESVGNNAYVFEEDGYTSIIIPFRKIQTKELFHEIPYQFYNNLKSKYKKFYGVKEQDKNDKYLMYIPCQELIYKINNGIDFDMIPIVVYTNSRVKETDMTAIISQKFNKIVRLGSDLYNFIGDQIKQFYKENKKSIEKVNKDFNGDLTNINLDDVSKRLEVITDINSQEGPEAEAKNREDFFSSAHGRTLMLDPQHLIRTENYMSVMSVEQTAQANLRNIKKIEKNNPINYLAANIIFNTIENVAKENASEKVDIFDDEVKVELDQIKNYNKKNVSAVNTLDGLKDDTVGYSIVKTISTKPVEILSPMVLANMDDAIKWGKDGDMTSKQIIEKIFGQENMKNAKISYPLASTKFFDSYMAIPFNSGYRIMKVSTKGGINGAGASASLQSIYEMIVNDKGSLYNNSEKIIKLVQSMQINEGTAKQFLGSIGYELTPYGIALSKNYLAEMIFLIIFGGTSTRNHQTLFTYLKRNKFFGIDYSHCSSISDYIKASSSALNITECVIKLLNYQKYDIAQINCTPRIEGDKFWYDYAIQYPAHFSGEVKLENSRKGVTFHIMASKS